MTEPAITREAAETLIEQGTALRVTKEAILAKIVGFEYEIKGTTTHAFLTIDNGFVIHGEAGYVDPANFNAQIGQRLAYDNAFNRLWPLMGFALAEKLLAAK